EQLHGKELSFNNLLDVDAALAAVAPWSGSDRVACAIIKHTTPCGIALGRRPAEAYERALATDRTSAFGSVIAFNSRVDRAAGAVLASDAFFPFPDGVEEAAQAGVRAIIQPGGSVKDADVIAAADRHDLAMVLTGLRQFRH